MSLKHIIQIYTVSLSRCTVSLIRYLKIRSYITHLDIHNKSLSKCTVKNNISREAKTWRKYKLLLVTCIYKWLHVQNMLKYKNVLVS